MEVVEIKTLWVENGRPLLRAPKSRGSSHLVVADTSAQEQESWFLRDGLVKLVADDTGVTIKWSIFAANWASLFFAREWLLDYAGPFRLQYFLAGWFTETIDNPGEAAARIDTLIAKSDIHLSTRTFVKSLDPGRARLTNLISKTIENGVAEPDVSVELVRDDNSGRYAVARMGPKSTIANIWGFNPVSYPCLSGHSYDQIVSQAYDEVSRRGGIHYDHVMAAMTAPDSSVFWLPYQRVVMPHVFPDQRKGVVVVTEVGDVDIRIV